MKTLSFKIFLLVIILSSIFITRTGNMLPILVASHFGVSGAANGWMPREMYVRFMLGFAIGLPLLLMFVTMRGLNNSDAHARIRLPNREYWLDPVRSVATIEYLQGHMAWFGILVVVFLSVVHWLVIVANHSVPAGLPSALFLECLAVFLVAVGVWNIVLLRRFRTMPPEHHFVNHENGERL